MKTIAATLRAVMNIQNTGVMSAFVNKMNFNVLTISAFCKAFIVTETMTVATNLMNPITVRSLNAQPISSSVAIKNVFQRHGSVMVLMTVTTERMNQTVCAFIT